MGLTAFNALSDRDAGEALQRCCVSTRWITGMLKGRPYADADVLRESADSIWSGLAKTDILEAFEGHPKIGDVHSLQTKYASSGGLAASEQAGVAGAAAAVIQRLADGNRLYEHRYGYIFIVCASGKTASEMCELLETRLSNPANVELPIAAEEQRKILQLRLERLL